MTIHKKVKFEESCLVIYRFTDEEKKALNTDKNFFVSEKYSKYWINKHLSKIDEFVKEIKPFLVFSDENTTISKAFETELEAFYYIKLMESNNNFGKLLDRIRDIFKNFDIRMNERMDECIFINEIPENELWEDK